LNPSQHNYNKDIYINSITLGCKRTQKEREREREREREEEEEEDKI
jgi:hypothetical protein